MSDIFHAAGSSSAEFAEEQDRAAGGREARKVTLDDGTQSLASIRLHRLKRKPNRIYAYLRYRVHGKTETRYVGAVAASNRAEALRLAWQMVRDKGILAR